MCRSWKDTDKISLLMGHKFRAGWVSNPNSSYVILNSEILALLMSNSSNGSITVRLLSPMPALPSPFRAELSLSRLPLKIANFLSLPFERHWTRVVLDPGVCTAIWTQVNYGLSLGTRQKGKV
jgi:hypothetical protein